MSKSPIVEAALGQDVVWVYEDGTADPFYALYVDGKLVATNPRGEVGDVLTALRIEPRTLFVAQGFEGNFPARLADLKVVKRRR